ncbi:MAG: hypothetical protein R3B69_00010 [Candidatus Paceibacterota bacterium]
MLYKESDVKGLEFTSQGDTWKVTGVTEDGRNLKGVRRGGSKGELPLNSIEQRAVNHILQKREQAAGN